MALAAALAARRTIRELGPEGISDAELGQLLWAAQGITHDGFRRTAPSASALFALEVYVATAEGLARYEPEGHRLETCSTRDLRAELQSASGDQTFIGSAPLTIILCTVTARLSGRHGADRAVRYADFEAGHVGQNLLLQATALGLSGVPVGSFDDATLIRLLGLPEGQTPRYLFAIGRPR